MRWQHPVKGTIQAGAFIDVAEETGSIREIGGFVLQQACSRLAAWRETSPALTINVNVSAAQLRHGASRVTSPRRSPATASRAAHSRWRSPRAC